MAVNTYLAGARLILELFVFVCAGVASASMLPTSDTHGWYLMVVLGLVALFALDLRRLGIGLATYFLFLAVLWPGASFMLFWPTGELQPFLHTKSLMDSAAPILVWAYVLAYLLCARTFEFFRMTAEDFDRRIYRDFLSQPSKLGPYATSVLAAACLVSAYIYQPSMPGAEYGDLEYNLVAGNAWNYLCLGTYFFVIFGQRDVLLRRIALVGVPTWLLLHYDRGELIGLLAFAGFLYLWRSRSSPTPGELFRRILYASTAIVCVLAFAYLGYMRLYGVFWDPQIFKGVVLSLANYSTLQQVNHSTAAGVELWRELGTFGFWQEYWTRLIPSMLVDHPRSAEVLVADLMETNNGMHFQGEMLMNFGVAGIAFGPVLIVSWMWLTLRAYAKLWGHVGYFFAFYLTLLLVVRIGWYGIFYHIKVMVTVAPLLLLLVRFTQQAEHAFVQHIVTRSAR